MKKNSRKGFRKNEAKYLLFVRRKIRLGFTNPIEGTGHTKTYFVWYFFRIETSHYKTCTISGGTLNRKFQLKFSPDINNLSFQVYGHFHTNHPYKYFLSSIFRNHFNGRSDFPNTTLTLSKMLMSGAKVTLELVFIDKMKILLFPSYNWIFGILLYPVYYFKTMKTKIQFSTFGQRFWIWSNSVAK